MTKLTEKMVEQLNELSEIYEEINKIKEDSIKYKASLYEMNASEKDLSEIKKVIEYHGDLLSNFFRVYWGKLLVFMNKSLKEEAKVLLSNLDISFENEEINLLYQLERDDDIFRKLVLPYQLEKLDKSSFSELKIFIIDFYRLFIENTTFYDAKLFEGQTFKLKMKVK